MTLSAQIMRDKKTLTITGRSNERRKNQSKWGVGAGAKLWCILWQKGGQSPENQLNDDDDDDDDPGGGLGGLKLKAFVVVLGVHTIQIQKQRSRPHIVENMSLVIVISYELWRYCIALPRLCPCLL
jgi:hypothetical protein